MKTPKISQVEAITKSWKFSTRTAEEKDGDSLLVASYPAPSRRN